MKRKMYAAAAIALTAFMLSACGSAAESAPVETEAAVEAEEPEAEETEAAESETAETEMESEETEAGDAAETAVDVTKGTAEALSEETADAGVEAMKAGFFAGDSRTLDEIFTAYDSTGSWSGIVSKQGDICVFYGNSAEGDDYYAVNFVIETDGSFTLTNVTRGDTMLEGAEAESFVQDVVNGVQ